MGLLKPLLVINGGIAIAFGLYAFLANPTTAEYARSDGKTVTLSDGRAIGFTSSGKEDSDKVILFFPGIPGSRFSPSLNTSELNQTGIRIITLERPGVGLSSPSKNFTVASYAEDIEEVADRLGLREFSVAGFSGGAPFAIATAARLPKRVQRVALFGPVYRYPVLSWADIRTHGLSDGLFLQTHYPLLTRALVRCMAPALTNVESAARHEEASLDPIDAKLFAELNSPFRASLRTDIAEMHRNGVESFIRHGQLLLNAYDTSDFDASRVTVPMAVWHGRADGSVPFDLSLRLEKDQPAARVFIVDNLGHYSCFNKFIFPAAKWLVGLESLPA